MRPALDNRAAERPRPHVARKRAAMRPSRRINTDEPVKLVVKEVVAEMPVMLVDVKVHQYKEAREPVIPPPKRIRHPRIQIGVIRGRRIIGDHRGPLFAIVVIDYGGVIFCRLRISFGRTARVLTHYRQIVVIRHIMKRLERIIFCHGQAA